MDTCVCMGAAIGVGLGLRHSLPPEQARKVVSVMAIPPSYTAESPALVEMVYNPPATGHVLVILDNGTTAMTGMQEHPGTGRRLDHEATGRVVFEDFGAHLGHQERTHHRPGCRRGSHRARVAPRPWARDEIVRHPSARRLLPAWPPAPSRIREKKANAGQ